MVETEGHLKKSHCVLIVLIRLKVKPKQKNNNLIWYDQLKTNNQTNKSLNVLIFSIYKITIQDLIVCKL